MKKILFFSILFLAFAQLHAQGDFYVVNNHRTKSVTCTVTAGPNSSGSPDCANLYTYTFTVPPMTIWLVPSFNASGSTWTKVSTGLTYSGSTLQSTYGQAYWANLKYSYACFPSPVNGIVIAHCDPIVLTNTVCSITATWSTSLTDTYVSFN